MTNPLLADWQTPFNIAPFDRVRDEDFAPAFDAALAQARADIDAIAGNPDAPTFANTVEALETSGKALDKVLSVFLLARRRRQQSETAGIAARIQPENWQPTARRCMATRRCSGGSKRSGKGAKHWR